MSRSTTATVAPADGQFDRDGTSDAGGGAGDEGHVPKQGVVPMMQGSLRSDEIELSEHGNDLIRHRHGYARAVGAGYLGEVLCDVLGLKTSMSRSANQPVPSPMKVLA